tara:strand:+ start:5039 stop:5614 length:576 start_codon:yes stop_codon:yes gene_type:complete
MNQENHEIKTFGSQFFIESGSEDMEYSGRAVYKIAATTKDDKKNNISFHETGFARYYTEDKFQIESGIKGSTNENNFTTIVHKGNYTVNADKGEIRLKAKNIIIEATDNLSLLAPNTIQIGYPEKGATKEVLTNADKVHTTTRGGNIGDLLKTSSLFSSFSGSFVPSGSLASAAAGMYGGPIAGALAKKFF